MAAEVELLRDARDGDSLAAEQLFEIYLKGSRSILGFLKRALPDPEDREEMLHEIFLRLITGTHNFRGDARLSTYIYRIARVTLLQTYRRRNTLKRGRMYRVVSEEPVQIADGIRTNPEYIYSLKELRQILNDVIEKLPATYREVVRLRVMDDLRYDEIAERTHLPVSTVSTKIHKGKKILGGYLRQLQDFPAQIPQ